MALDLAPYDAIDDEYEENEQETLILRMIQSAEPGAPVREADLMILNRWVLEFQKRRGLMAIALRGLAKVRVVEGELGFEASLDAPLPSLEELAADDERPDGWLDDRLDPDALT